MVVFPAASRPTIKILISFFPHNRSNSFENVRPILAVLCWDFLVVEKAVWERIGQHKCSKAQSLSGARIVHGAAKALQVDLMATYRTMDRVPVVIFYGHFVLVPGLVQATGIKKSLPELVGDRGA